MPALVGREREQAILRDALAAAQAGRGSLVLIGGEAGLGKTTLAEAVCAEATAQGALVLVGRSYDLAETPPYGPWADLFGRRLHGPDDPPAPAAFAERGTVGAVTSQTALTQQVADFLAAIAARQPALVLLEDLHWADPASLDLLRALARTVAEWALLLIATYRADELTRHHPLYQLLPALVREARATRLDLRPLGSAGLRALATAHHALTDADADRLADYLHARSEGNPFFAGELLRTLEEEGALRLEGQAWALSDLSGLGVPALLRQVVDARLARLGEEAHRLLSLAAVVGQEVPLTLWAAVAETDEDGLLDTIERATEARLLEALPAGDAARFPHALIREALYEGIVPMRRRRAHLRVAEALASQSTPDPDAVASHFQRATDPRAFEWLIRAGLRAYRAAAWLTAADRFAAATALPDVAGSRPRTCGWLIYSRAQLLTFSDNAASQRALEAAAPLLPEANDAMLAAYVRIARGRLRALTGELRLGLAEIERGVAALEQLPAEFRPQAGYAGIGPVMVAALLSGGELAAAPPQPDLQPPVPDRYLLMSWFGHTGRYRDALALGESLLTTLDRAGTTAVPTSASIERAGTASMLGTVLVGIGYAYAACGQPDAARRVYARGREVFAAANNAHMIEFTIWCELQLILLPYRTDDIAERTRLTAESARVWEYARGTMTDTDHADPAGMLTALLEGRWGAADQVAHTTLDAATAGHAQGAIVALGLLARHRGDPDAAWARVRALHPAGPETEPGDCYFHQGIALQALAVELALDAGDPGLAEHWIAAHGRWLDWSGALLWQAEHSLLEARLARVSGDQKSAREYADAALAHASEPRQPLALLAAHRFLGEVDTTEGRHADATAHLDTALALADACAAPYERALTLLALAELRAASGQHDRAREALDEARRILAPLEAQPALARADKLAARLAAPAPTAALPFGLTAREAEVLRLVAEGLSDAQVAERLFLSPYTVKAHLRSIYNKTAAPSRIAAAHLARAHGLA